jgi:protocatechuate 3,4-dioxygenase beta subunit
MSRLLHLLTVVTVLLAAAGCVQITDPDDPENAVTVLTTITGRVVDEAGKSVQGALVKGHGKTATTNGNGVFVLQNVEAPSTRAVVVVSKSGYFTGARAAFPSANKITTVTLTLQEAKQTRTISAESGGKVTLGDASVDLPANAYVDARGNSYSGTITVAARYQDPLADTYYESFSGDMAALRADGSSVELTSYGVVRVLLTGAQGQSLNLAKGATATISYPAAGATEQSIPLWYFDETKGIWTEEGTATRSGDLYVGTVTHFTDWNLDVPNARRAFIEGQVTCGENVPLAGIVVEIGQVSAITDQDGMFRRRVPADVAFDVQVKGTRNDGIASAPVTVGPIAENQTLRRDIVVSPCPTVIEAQMVDCNDAPIGGFLQVITPTGVKIGSSTTGRILVTVPAGVALTLEGYSIDGRTITSTPVTAIAVGTTFNVGSLKACGGIETSYLDIVMPDNQSPRFVSMNNDGSRVAVVTQNALFVYDASTGAQQWTEPVQSSTQYPMGLQFVANGQRLALTSNKGTTMYDAATGQVIASIVAYGRQFVTPDGASVYVMRDSATDMTLEEYDAQTGAQRRTLAIAAQLQKRGFFMGLQGNGFAVIQGYSPTAIITVDLTDGSVARTFTGLGDSTSIAEAGTLSPSGKVLVMFGRSDTSSRFIDLLTGMQISQITSRASILTISPDDDQFVSRGYTQGAPITLSALRTQQLLRVLPWSTAAQTDYPSGFSFSAGMSKLAGITAGSANNPGGGTGSGARIRVFSLK